MSVQRNHPTRTDPFSFELQWLTNGQALAQGPVGALGFTLGASHSPSQVRTMEWIDSVQSVQFERWLRSLSLYRSLDPTKCIARKNQLLMHEMGMRLPFCVVSVWPAVGRWVGAPPWSSGRPSFSEFIGFLARSVALATFHGSHSKLFAARPPARARLKSSDRHPAAPLPAPSPSPQPPALRLP